MRTLSAVICTICNFEEAIIHVTYEDGKGDLVCRPCNKELSNKQINVRRALIQHDPDGRFL